MWLGHIRRQLQLSKKKCNQFRCDWTGDNSLWPCVSNILCPQIWKTTSRPCNAVLRHRAVHVPCMTYRRDVQTRNKVSAKITQQYNTQSRSCINLAMSLLAHKTILADNFYYKPGNNLRDKWESVMPTATTLAVLVMLKRRDYWLANPSSIKFASFFTTETLNRSFHNTLHHIWKSKPLHCYSHSVWKIISL